MAGDCIRVAVRQSLPPQTRCFTACSKTLIAGIMHKEHCIGNGEQMVPQRKGDGKGSIWDAWSLTSQTFFGSAQLQPLTWGARTVSRYSVYMQPR